MAKSQTTDHRGNPENLVPQFPQLAHALSGIDLPQNKKGLKQQAQKNGASREILELIDDMPEQQYETMADVMAGVKKKT